MKDFQNDSSDQKETRGRKVRWSRQNKSKGDKKRKSTCSFSEAVVQLHAMELDWDEAISFQTMPSQITTVTSRSKQPTTGNKCTRLETKLLPKFSTIKRIYRRRWMKKKKLVYFYTFTCFDISSLHTFRFIQYTQEWSKINCISINCN